MHERGRGRGPLGDCYRQSVRTCRGTEWTCSYTYTLEHYIHAYSSGSCMVRNTGELPW